MYASVMSTFKCKIMKGIGHMAQFQNQMISIIILDADATLNLCSSVANFHKYTG